VTVPIARTRKASSLYLILIATALAFALATPAAADSAQVIHRTALCSVGFDSDDAVDLDCDVVNIARPNGGYTLVIHGQVQPDDMERFLASGVRRYSAEWPEGECLASYLFFVEEGHDKVYTDSVRHFTPNGKMTEICHYKP
jgi:hypothetical protein